MKNINAYNSEARPPLSTQNRRPFYRTILDEEVAYMFDFIKRVCTEVGPGIPCSPQEQQRALLIKS